jgi:molecular chaperone GrpE (heat shock protein)
MSVSVAERLSLLNTSWAERMLLLNSSLGERIALTNASLEERLSATNGLLENRLSSMKTSLEDRLSAMSATLENRISSMNVSLEERLSLGITAIASLEERFSVTGASLEKQLAASSLEQPLSLMDASLEDRLSLMSAALEDHLAELEDQMQQNLRHERRRQMALESLLESQNKTLEVLERPEMSPPLEALMALAENFMLEHLSKPETPTSAVLYGKLTDLMACYDLSVVAESGITFDPEIHEACGANWDPSRPENTVLEIVRPGFLLRGKMLRCATVVVNRQVPDESEPPRD